MFLEKIDHKPMTRTFREDYSFESFSPKLQWFLAQQSEQMAGDNQVAFS
jgi:hypothetical protein